MISRLLKIIPYKTAAFILAVVIAALFYFAVHSYLDYSISKPMPVTGTNRTGYDFTVVAMNDNMPVELTHEWFGYAARVMECSSRKGAPSGHELRALVESELKHKVIWADTGRASGHYRYYLTDADLRKANSLLNSKPGEHPHKVSVALIENDPAIKHQTLQVTISGDRTNFLNVYQVANERVKPLAWRRYRPVEADIGAMALAPFAFVFSLVFLRWRLRRVAS